MCFDYPPQVPHFGADCAEKRGIVFLDILREPLRSLRLCVKKLFVYSNSKTKKTVPLAENGFQSIIKNYFLMNFCVATELPVLMFT
jgi:hypothetical protein